MSRPAYLGFPHSRILALIVEGANQPKMSNFLAMSDTRARFDILATSGKDAIVRRKWSWLAFQAIPNVLVYSSGLDVMC